MKTLKTILHATDFSELSANAFHDFINIRAHKKHRVEWTTPDEPTIWLAVHYGDKQ